jgi:hypothetical protein
MQTLNYGFISICIMTKTIFRKKLLMLATITVLVTGLMLTATFNDAEAKKDKAPKAPSTKTLNCKDNVGAFVSLGIDAFGGPFVSTGESKCKSIGDAAFTSITALTGALGVSGGSCLALVGAGPGGFDGYGISKKGFFTTTVDAGMEQCFFNSAGDPLAAPPTSFCGAALTDAHTSVVTGEFTITGGLIKGAVVTAGSGMLISAVDHCAMGAAPGGDSTVTTLTGTITY